MKTINTFTWRTVAILLFLTTPLVAQQNQVPLTAEEQQTVVDSISSKLKTTYVFPEVAKEMAASITSKLGKGGYTSISDPHEFATTLTTDLRAVSKDKHISVSFAPGRIKEQQQRVTAEDSIAYLNRYISSLQRGNFGFREVKIMPGNIGYLDLRSFSNVEYAGETAVAAMNFLSHADAIIIDLRNNGGGSPAMIQLISKLPV